MIDPKGRARNSNGVTQFQEEFCRQYILLGSAAAAYRAVNPKAATWQDKSVWQRASNLMARVNVASRITQMQEQAARRAGSSPESLASELDTHIAQAVALGDPGVAVAAVMGKAKLFGFLVDKKEIRTGALDNLSFEDLRIVDDALTSLAHAERISPADTGETSH